MLSSPFTCYRSHYQQVGPWYLRLVTWTLVGLAIGAAYWILYPLAVVAMIARQWLT